MNTKGNTEESKEVKPRRSFWACFIPLSLLLSVFLSGSQILESYRVRTSYSTDNQLIKKLASGSLPGKFRQLEESFSPALYDELSSQDPNNGYLDSLWVAHHYRKSVDLRSNKVSDQQLFLECLSKWKDMLNKPKFNRYLQEEYELIRGLEKQGMSKLYLKLTQQGGIRLPVIGLYRSYAKVALNRSTDAIDNKLHKKAIDELAFLADLLEYVCKNPQFFIEIYVVDDASALILENDKLHSFLVAFSHGALDS
ncbi:MAG: hypothetical protein NE334_20290 [Lentisphaeraceae bacterium]|nr:hypothetical protein [Lentisphaeraceae bacterium]